MPNGSQNYELVGNNCQNIEDLTVTLTVTEDLVMDIGFSLQLNVLPQPQERQLQPQPYPGISLNWLQYVLYFQNTQFSVLEHWCTCVDAARTYSVASLPNRKRFALPLRPGTDF